MNPFDYFQDLLVVVPGAKHGKMFGYPSLNVGRKPFAFFHADTEQHAAFKLPSNIIEEHLSLEGFALFNPSGNSPMRQWLQVPIEQVELWPVLAKAAHEYLIQ